MKVRTLIRATAASLLILVASADASAQIGGLGRALGRVAQSTGVGNVLNKEPITTSLPDAKWGDS